MPKEEGFIFYIIMESTIGQIRVMDDDGEEEEVNSYTP